MSEPPGVNARLAIAYAGRALFRHKTRKQPFGDNLRAIAQLQGFAVTALIAYALFGDALGLGFAA